MWDHSEVSTLSSAAGNLDVYERDRVNQPLPSETRGTANNSTALQSHNAVTANFSSKQLLHFGFSSVDC